jgi:hypothetical protein
MRLIDCSYFYDGPLQIENAADTGGLDNNSYAVQEAIGSYIDRFQDDFLRNMVGDALAEEIEQRMENVDTDDIEDLLERLRLPFAHYVYFKMVGDVNQVMTITGLVRLKSANDSQPPRQRMVSVWNEMVELNKRFVRWAAESNYDVYYRVNMVTPINQFNI